MLESMTAASLHEFLKQKGCRDGECSLFEEIVAGRRHMEELSSGCLDGEVGWQTEYEKLSPDEFLLRAGSMIARHENHAARLEDCLQQLRPMVAEVTAASDELVALMMSTGVVETNQQLAELMKLVVKTNKRYFATIRDVYPLMIAIERAYGLYFRHLQATGARSVAAFFGEPVFLAELERQIVVRFQQNAAGKVGEAELYYRLAPSAEAAARLVHVMVKAVWYEFIDALNRLDAVPNPRQLRKLEQEARGLIFMFSNAASATQAAFPAAGASYESARKSMERAKEVLQSYMQDMSTLPSEHRDELGTLIRGRSSNFGQSVGRIDAELSVIDRMLKPRLERGDCSPGVF